MHRESHSETWNRSSDRAVSPVIGVVLMVAITIILAATIGSLVFGLTPTSDATTPVASITLEGEVGDDAVTIVHDGGDPIDLNEVALLVDGEPNGELDELNETLRSGQRESINTTEPLDEVDLALRHEPSGELLARTTAD